ncbi:IclR family transcriptional regulator [Roseibium sp. SCPC15]|jgi:IclR family pca regulon transcriptional regulator|uniref:IclR family transcriptional regulator n=1 Tax=Roseibium sp. SCP15 TaxID=3141376 RepID=UPI0033389BB0
MSTPLNGSLIKAFEILRLFDEDQSELSAVTVAQKLGLNTSTAHRFLLTLEHVGALTSLRRGHFGLGPRLEELGRLAELTNPLPVMVKPVLDAVSKDLNESVMACRLNRLGPVCVSVSESERSISVIVKTGTVLPFQHSAQGRLWLAHMTPETRASYLQDGAVLRAHSQKQIDPESFTKDLETVRGKGYALNLGDNEPDIAAVSVPVWNAEGDMILSLSVFGMLSRFDAEFVERAKSRLRAASSEISSKWK